MKFHDGKVSRDMVYIFQSDIKGRHNKIALSKGARYGSGVGLSGNTFAIPFYDEDGDPFKLNQIQPYVERILKITKEFPNTKFYIDYMKHPTSPDKEVARLFSEFGNNCFFPKQWRNWLI